MDTQYDFIAMGDVVTDAFIRLQDAMVDNERGMLCMRFKDKIPYESVTVIPAVGNSANAAFSATRLGLKTAFVSNIGADDFGREVLDALAKENISADFVTKHENQKTNYHYVLWFQDDRTILVKHEEYDYAMPDIGNPKWVYLSSLGGNSLMFHKKIEKYFKDRPDIKLAFQPGTYQIKFGKDALKGLYERADLMIANKEEFQRILETNEDDVKALLDMMQQLGPKIVVLTDGKKGAYLKEDSTVWMMPPYPDPKPPLDRTGAGDAFSSTFTVALALGMDIPSALRWAPINSMSVVQYIGAREGLLTREKLEEYLTKAPEDYISKQI